MHRIKHYFPEVTETQLEKFEKMVDLYKEWNNKINVISRKDIDSIVERHILHSLGIAKVITFKEGSVILDVGTGGGFPGIPLAVLYPNCKFILVDSIGKKIKVVQEIAKALELNNVDAFHERVENVPVKVDFVVSRAVTRFAPFYEWVKDKFKKDSFNSIENGILYLKGGDLEEEMAEYGKNYSTISLSSFFSEEFFETKKVVIAPVILKK